MYAIRKAKKLFICKEIRFLAGKNCTPAIFNNYQRLILIVCQNLSNAILERVLVGLDESTWCTDEDRNRL